MVFTSAATSLRISIAIFVPSRILAGIWIQVFDLIVLLEKSYSAGSISNPSHCTACSLAETGRLGSCPKATLRVIFWDTEVPGMSREGMRDAGWLTQVACNLRYPQGFMHRDAFHFHTGNGKAGAAIELHATCSAADESNRHREGRSRR